MDVLLIDPPYKSLKGVMAEFAYPLGLVDLAGDLRAKGMDAAVLSADLLLDVPPTAVFDFDLAAYAAGQRAYAAAVRDTRHEIWSNLADALSEAKPALVGIMALTPALDSVLRTAEVVRKTLPGIPLIVGGHHATFCAEELLATGLFDIAVCGEGEHPLSGLAAAVLKGNDLPHDLPGTSLLGPGGVQHNPRPTLLQDLDDLAAPARDAVIGCDFTVFSGHLAGSARGCPYDCSFCADRRLWGGRVRRRSVDNMISELKSLTELGPVTSLDFVDGTFTFDKRWLLEFCRRMEEEALGFKWRCTARYDNMDEEVLTALQRAGCTGLYFGLESGSQAVLDAAGKRTTVDGILAASRAVRASGIPSITSILLGLPEETAEDLERTLGFMEEVETDIFDINCYVPLPGTRYHDTGGHSDVDWTRVGYKSFENHFNPHMTAEELESFLRRAYSIAANRMAAFKKDKAQS